MIKNLMIAGLLVLFIFIVNCDSGLDSGDDLVGKWARVKKTYLGYTDTTKEIYTFKSDGSGDYEYDGDSASSEYNIEYKVITGGTYKVLEVTDYSISGGYKLSTDKFDYYFSIDKNKLYLKQTNGDSPEVTFTEFEKK